MRGGEGPAASVRIKRSQASRSRRCLRCRSAGRRSLHWSRLVVDPVHAASAFLPLDRRAHVEVVTSRVAEDHGVMTREHSLEESRFADFAGKLEPLKADLIECGLQRIAGKHPLPFPVFVEGPVDLEHGIRELVRRLEPTPEVLIAVDLREWDPEVTAGVLDE